VLQNRMYFALAQENNENFDQLQLLMDNTIKVKPTKKNSASIARLEGLSRRLMFKLHIKRKKLLESDRDKACWVTFISVVLNAFCLQHVCPGDGS
jgi:hypothetical protein